MKKIDHFARKPELFIGGPCDGEVVQAHITASKHEVFRSCTRGDDTMYFYKGVGFQRYYRFFGAWRWEGLDTFDTLFLPDAIDEANRHKRADY